jgi:hypothetical protein
VTTPPARLGARGLSLWEAVTSAHTLAAPELEILAEACRCTDRLERLDEQLTGSDMAWLDLEKMRRDDHEYRVTVDAALSEARQQQNILKQLVASLRLPDGETGKKPERRGARGAYAPRPVNMRDRMRSA